MLAVILCLTQSITALADAEIGAGPPPTIGSPVNNPNYTTYVKIDGAVYCYSWAALELWGMDDKYVFIDHNFNGIAIFNPFNPIEEETEVAKSTFYKFNDMNNYVYLHDADGTLYSVDPEIMGRALEGTAKFYKCISGNLIPISEEEAVSLGYVEE